MVEKNYEFALDEPKRKFEYRVVVQGNQVHTQNLEVAMFQDLGSSPASMEAEKAVQAFGFFRGMTLSKLTLSRPTFRRSPREPKHGLPYPKRPGLTSGRCRAQFPNRERSQRTATVARLLVYSKPFMVTQTRGPCGKNIATKAWLARASNLSPAFPVAIDTKN